MKLHEHNVCESCVCEEQRQQIEALSSTRDMSGEGLCGACGRLGRCWDIEVAKMLSVQSLSIAELVPVLRYSGVDQSKPAYRTLVDLQSDYIDYLDNPAVYHFVKYREHFADESYRDSGLILQAEQHIINEKAMGVAAVYLSTGGDEVAVKKYSESGWKHGDWVRFDPNSQYYQRAGFNKLKIEYPVPLTFASLQDMKDKYPEMGEPVIV